MRFTFTFLFIVATFTTNVFAGEFITLEPGTNSYQYVSSYNIKIDATTEEVWGELVNLGSWMYEFEMSNHSGNPGQVGEVLRLYPNQEFFVQITGKVKKRMLTIANLPATFNGEHSTGVGVITLNQLGSETVVDITLSRRFTWQGEGENPMKNKRESSEFQRVTGATWTRFLQRLQELAEEA